MTNHVVWKPQPGPQEALIRCPSDVVFFGGQRGGGKTHGIQGDWLSHWRKGGGHSAGVLFRRTHPQLEEIIKSTKGIYPAVGAKYYQSGGGGHSQWVFPGGAVLKLRHLDREADADNYQGHQYSWIGIDEAGSFPSPAPIDKLLGALRSPYGLKCRMVLTGNPGGPGHAWLKKRFIDHIKPNTVCDVYTRHNAAGDPTETIVPYGTKCNEGEYVGTRCFIPAALSDNPALIDKDPNYRARLLTVGSRALVRAWLHGDWNINIDGAAWRYEDIDNNRVKKHPELRLVVVGVDPSATSKKTSDPTAIVAAGLGVDGDYYVLRAEDMRKSPNEWATALGRICDSVDADHAVAETNQGGEMVTTVIRNVRPDIAVRTVHAKKGKELRADPVVVMYQQGRVHHVGYHQRLEDQMITFPVSCENDDLVDANVYAILDLMRKSGGESMTVTLDDSAFGIV